jgi:hypothetical protein
LRFGLAFDGAYFGQIEVKVADWIAVELFPLGLVSYYLRQTADAMALNYLLGLMSLNKYNGTPPLCRRIVIFLKLELCKQILLNTREGQPQTGNKPYHPDPSFGNRMTTR